MYLLPTIHWYYYYTYYIISISFILFYSKWIHIFINNIIRLLYISYEVFKY